MARPRQVVAFLLFLMLAACTAPGETRSSAPQIAALERENAELRAQVDSLNTQLAVLRKHFGITATVCPAYPKIDASVLAVHRDNKTVVFDKGTKDGVGLGYVFDVYLGTDYKGLVRISDVQETTCSGVILSETRPIAPGDSATQL